MTNPAVMSTPKYPCVLQTLFLTKMNQVFLGKKFIPGLRQEMYKMSLEHTIILESKETIRQPELYEKDSAASGAGSQSMVKDQAVRAPVRVMAIL